MNRNDREEGIRDRDGVYIITTRSHHALQPQEIDYGVPYYARYRPRGKGAFITTRQRRFLKEKLRKKRLLFILYVLAFINLIEYLRLLSLYY